MVYASLSSFIFFGHVSCFNYLLSFACLSPMFCFKHQQPILPMKHTQFLEISGDFSRFPWPLAPSFHDQEAGRAGPGGVGAAPPEPMALLQRRLKASLRGRLPGQSPKANDDVPRMRAIHGHPPSEFPRDGLDGLDGRWLTC